MRYYYGWLIMALSFLVLVTANGVVLTFGVFLVPVSDDLQMTRGFISLAMALFMAVQGLGAPLVGYNIDRLGPRRVVLAGLGILAAGAAAMAYIATPLHLFLVFGLVMGIGYSCVTLLTNSVIISRWFQKRRGLAMGISMSGLPVGPLIFSPLNALLIERIGWQSTYLVLAGLVAIVVLPVLWLFLRNGPDAYPETEFAGGRPAPVTAPRWSIGQALKRTNFRLLAGSYFACGFTMAMVQTHFPAHALQVGLSEVLAATAFGMMGLWAIAGTVSAGSLSDRLGRKRVLATVYGTRMVSLLLMAWAPSAAVLMLAAVVFGLSWTATGPLTSMLTGEIFGLPSMGLLFGTVFFSHQVGATLGVFLGGVVFDLTGYYQLAWLAGALVLGSASWLSHHIVERVESPTLIEPVPGR